MGDPKPEEHHHHHHEHEHKEEEHHHHHHHHEHQHIHLIHGVHMPVVGLGTWLVSKPGEAAAAVEHALNHGYTLVDCAERYGNQKEIGTVFGRLLSDPEKRAKVFVTSKLWCTRHRPEDIRPSIEKTLKDLQLNYLDLYLIHFPEAFPKGATEEQMGKKEKNYEHVTIHETWKAMEEIHKSGLVKSIGVSNFSIKDLEDLLSTASVKPAVNQIEVHPYLTNTELITFCKTHEIAVTAYTPLANQSFIHNFRGEEFARQVPPVLENEIVKKLALKYNKTPAQILVRFAVDRGLAVIPKSVTPSRIEENINVFDFQLSKEDVDAILTLNRNLRIVDPSWHHWTVRYQA